MIKTGEGDADSRQTRSIADRTKRGDGRCDRRVMAAIACLVLGVPALIVGGLLTFGLAPLRWGYGAFGQWITMTETLLCAGVAAIGFALIVMGVFMIRSMLRQSADLSDTR
jgi:hypothetical protein